MEVEKGGGRGRSICSRGGGGTAPSGGQRKASGRPAWLDGEQRQSGDAQVEAGTSVFLQGHPERGYGNTWVPEHPGPDTGSGWGESVRRPALLEQEHDAGGLSRVRAAEMDRSERVTGRLDGIELGEG